MADFSALPLFTDAYLADCRHLTDAEHGRYLLFLMLIWRSPGCRVPNDNKWIARKMSRSPEDVIKDIRPLIAEFCSCTGNWITQKRLTKEFLYTQGKRKKNTDSIKSRWNKEKTSYECNTSTPTSGNTPSPSPSPSPTAVEKELPRGNSEKKIEPETFQDFWRQFPQQRRGNREKAAAAYRRALTRSPQEEIHEGLNRYSASAEVRTGFAKGAEAWLNDDRWRTDYTEPTRHSNPGQPKPYSHTILDAAERAEQQLRDNPRRRFNAEEAAAEIRALGNGNSDIPQAPSRIENHQRTPETAGDA